MTIGIIKDIDSQMQSWQKGITNTRLFQAFRPVEWACRVPIISIWFSLMAQQCGVADVRLQGMIGLVFGFSQLFWLAAEERRHKYLFFNVGLYGWNGLQVVGWVWALWQAWTTELASTNANVENWYAVALVLGTGIYTLAMGCMHLYDILTITKRNGNTDISFGLLYGYSWFLLLFYSAFGLVMYIQLYVQPPLLVRTVCFACVPKVPDYSKCVVL